MVQVEIIHVFSADHIDAAVPVLIQFKQGAELILLLSGKIVKIFPDDIGCLICG